MKPQTGDAQDDFQLSMDYVFTAISSWLIPGSGHWLLGYRLRGAILGVGLLGLFWVGETALAIGEILTEGVGGHPVGEPDARAPFGRQDVRAEGAAMLGEPVLEALGDTVGVHVDDVHGTTIWRADHGCNRLSAGRDPIVRSWPS